MKIFSLSSTYKYPEALERGALKKSLIFSFSLISQIGFATAIPLVMFGLIGRYLDRKYGTSPYLLLLGLAIATVQIYFYIKKIIKSALKEFEKTQKDSQ